MKSKRGLTTAIMRALSLSLGCIVFSMLLSPRGVCAQEKQDVSLLECIDRALEKNPGIRSAREKVVRSRLQIKEANSSILPKLSTSLEYIYQEGPIPYSNFSMPEDNYKFSLSLQQPLFDQGKYFILKPQANEGVKIAELDLDAAQQNILLGVISTYLKVLKAEEMLLIARESRERLAEHLRVTKRRFEVGQIAKNDVLRAEMELANAESDLIHAEKAVDLSYENLRKLTFMEDQSFTVIPVTYVSEDKNGTVEEMIERAYQKRPDYLQAVKIQEVAKMGISLAKRDFLPTVTLFGEYQKNWVEDFPDYENRIVGGSISLPLFEGGIKMVRLGRAHHDYALSEYQESDVKKQVRVEVIQAYLHLDDLLATQKAIEKQIEHAEENMRIVKLRYQEGEATNLDVLDANLLLVKARTDSATLNYDIMDARFSIDRAVGELTRERIRQRVERKTEAVSGLRR